MGCAASAISGTTRAAASAAAVRPATVFSFKEALTCSRLGVREDLPPESAAGRRAAMPAGAAFALSMAAEETIETVVADAI